jgi:hypothetical protein
MERAGAGTNSEICLQGRKMQIDAQCGVTDAVMYFIPVKPTLPGCWFITPKGCPKAEWRKTGLKLVWTVDTYGATKFQANLKENVCMDRKKAWDKFCGISDTKMLFIPLAGGAGTTSKMLLEINHHHREINTASAFMYNSTTADFDEAAMTAKVREMLKDATEMKNRLGSIGEDVSKLQSVVGVTRTNVQTSVHKTTVHKTVTTTQEVERNLAKTHDARHQDEGHAAAVSMHYSDKLTVTNNVGYNDGEFDKEMKVKVHSMLNDVAEMRQKLGTIDTSVSKLETAVAKQKSEKKANAKTAEDSDAKQEVPDTTTEVPKTMDGVSDALENAVSGATSPPGASEDGNEGIDASSAKLEEALAAR